MSILKCFLLLNRPWWAIADVWTSDSLRQACKETLERPMIRSKFSIADKLFFPSAELLPEKSIVDDGRCQRRSLLIEEPSKKIKPVSPKRRRYFWPMVVATEWRRHGCVTVKCWTFCFTRLVSESYSVRLYFRKYFHKWNTFLVLINLSLVELY